MYYGDFVVLIFCVLKVYKLSYVGYYSHYVEQDGSFLPQNKNRTTM